MPYSYEDGSGFDNRIAGVLAEALGAELVFEWVPLEQLNYVLSEYLYAGRCDMIFGLQDGEEGVLSSAAYYRSPYAFVYRSSAGFDVDSFDDPDLANARIGVLGGPAAAAFRRRAVSDQVAAWDRFTRYGSPNWLGEVVRAVANDELDVAVAWGPIAGYFAQQAEVDLTVTPVPSEVEPPFIFLVRPITVGFRPGDEAYRDRLDVALARAWDDVQAILAEYAVPLSPLPRPIESLEVQ